MEKTPEEQDWARNLGALAQMAIDYPAMWRALIMQVVAVEAVNCTLQATICPATTEPLACCDPMNTYFVTLASWGPRSAATSISLNGWLFGHFVFHCYEAYTRGKSSCRAHFNQFLMGFLWYLFEFLVFLHALELEQLRFWRRGDDGSLVSPCPENPYFSTWIPIWQDFYCNWGGQLLGWLLYRRFGAQQGASGAHPWRS